MKNVILLLVLSIFFSCETKEKEQKTSINEPAEAAQVTKYKVFGEDFSENSAISKEEMLLKYNTLQAGDSLEVIFKATVNSVCKKKGCWMKLSLNDTLESMVRFKDYGFFVPKNLNNNEMIVYGNAFVEETSVEELRHYAEDEGKSEEEIKSITLPKRTLSFTANGVKMNLTEYVDEQEADVTVQKSKESVENL